MKRTFDIIMSGLGLVALSPLLVAIGLVVFLQDRHKPFFTQERCGRGTTRFQIVKFHTMSGNNNTIKDYLHDGRVTPVGRILRQYHLDELLNLLNILKGDMSFVGPRPMPFEVDQELDPGYSNTYEIPGWEVRNSVRPGVTGLAQLYCPKMVSREHKFQFDVFYVEERTWRLDMSLITYTVKLMLKRLLAIRLTFSPVSLVLLLLAVVFLGQALDELLNLVSGVRSSTLAGVIGFGCISVGWLLLFVVARLRESGNK